MDNLEIEDLIYFGKILKKYSQPIPRDKLKKSNNFIKCAKRDLRASNYLFEKKMYAEYSYHLQQSVEKITKAYIVSLNTFSDKEIRKISHKTPKAYIKILEKEFKIFEILEKLAFDFETDFTDLKNTINSSSETEKIALISYNKINKLLDEYNKIFKKVNFDSLELNKKSVKNINDASKYVLNKTTLDKKTKIFFKRILRKIFTNKSVQTKIMNKKFRISSEEFVKNLLGLYFLSIITYPHEVYTRYPEGNVTPFNYKKNLGICKSKKKLFKILKNSIKVIEKDNKNKKVKD